MGGTLALWISLFGIMVSIVGGFPHQGLTAQHPPTAPEGMSPVYLRAAGPRATKSQWQNRPNVASWPWMQYSSPVALEPSQPPPLGSVHIQPINAELPKVPYPTNTKGSPPQAGSGVQIFEAAPVIDPHEPVQGPSGSSVPGSVPFSSFPAAKFVVPLDPSVPDPETTSILPGPPPPPPPPPIYKPGKVIRHLSIYEHGNEESEIHDTGDLIPPPPPLPEVSESSGSEASSLVYPPDVEHDDRFFQMFLAGQLIPGTITHIRSTYEHGHNAWTDIGFERIPLPPPTQAPKGRKKIPLPPSKQAKKG